MNGKIIALCMAAMAQPEPESPRVQILAFTMPNCGPCITAQSDYRPWLERSGWIVSPMRHAHIRLVDINAEPELAEAHGVESVPCFIVVSNGRAARRFAGYPGRTALVKAYFAEWNKR